MAIGIDARQSASSLFESGQLDECERVCHALLAANEADVNALRLLAAVARKRQRTAQSLELLGRALSLAPQNALLWFERGSTYLQASNLSEAELQFRQAVELAPQFAEGWLNLGGVLEQLERQQEAIAPMQRAIALRPDWHAAHYNLGNAYRGLGQVEAASGSFAKAVELAPDFVKAHWNLANTLLLQGQLKRGWEEYEWRDASVEVPIDPYPQPRWNGEPLADKTILVHAEQGIGDEVLFASCYPDLLDLAGRCIFVCERRLEKLFARSFPDATVYGYQRRLDQAPLALDEQIDFQVSAGSLPRHFRNDWNSFPDQTSFLVADPAAVAAWKRRFEELGPGLKIGISWRAGGKPTERRKRTTVLDQWSEIFAAPSVQWINLQYGDATDEIAAAREEMGITIHDFRDGDPLVDMGAFAAKVKALDLVISVGNATVHLAGALGVPTWAMLPRVPAWRWFLAGESCPWYPSVRLFRQQDHARWEAVFARVAAELAQRGENGGTPMVPTAEHRQINMDARGSNMRTASSGDTTCKIRDQAVLAEAIPRELEKGVILHQQGNYEAAESIYREVLHHAPRYPDALHLLGVLARQTGRVELAINSISRAISVNSCVPMMHYNLGNALRDASRFDDAVTSYRKAIELFPDFCEARLNLGITLNDSGQAEAAGETFAQLVELAPQCAEAYLNWGHALKALFRPDAALAQYRRALEIKPELAEAHQALAALLLEDDRADDAQQHAECALQLRPGWAAANHTLGMIAHRLGYHEAAIRHYRAAAESAPTSLETLANLSDALVAAGDYREAERVCRSALGLQPTNPAGLNNLGLALQEQGRLAEAIDCYRGAVRVQPDYPDAHCNLALALLEQGEFREGWREYEWRWRSADGLRPRPYWNQPRWSGEPLEGKTILVHGEQGIGDEIMFATCLPDVIRAAHRCIITCDRRLETLFKRSFPEANVWGVDRGHEQRWQVPANLQIDYQIASGSLPGILRNGLPDFPRQSQLLNPDPVAAAYWSARLAELGTGLKIGIAWQGGIKPQDKRRRWIPLADWKPLLCAGKAHFVSLQHGASAADVAVLEQTNIKVAHFADLDPKRNVEGLAALIAELDLVIAVGNATVHLAGAVGTPAWALLPAAGAWRWMAGRADSLWYPSVKVFRQTSPGEWGSVLAEVAQELHKFSRPCNRYKPDAA